MQERQRIVRRGPCCHCGTGTTPQWRKGPPEKPVLCNACGSRWRTKGTLADYMPIQPRTNAPVASKDFNNHKEDKLPSQTRTLSASIRKPNASDDTSSELSSGSETSDSDCADQLSSSDESDTAGPSPSSFWNTIPSRKRTIKFCQSHQRPPHIEELVKNLCQILKEQGVSHLSEASNEVLLLEREDSSDSIEIGLGCYLIKKQDLSPKENSETSPLKVEVDNPPPTHTCIRFPSFTAQSQTRGANLRVIGKENKHPPLNASPVKHLETPLFRNLNSPRSNHSLQKCINQHALKSENIIMDLPSCLPGNAGSRRSLPYKRPPDLLYSQGSKGLKNNLKFRKYNNAKAAPQNCLWRSYSSAASLKNRTASQEQKDLLAHQGISSIRRG